MDRLMHYRSLLKEVLIEYHQLNTKSDSNVESFLVFDESHDQYLLMLMGWNKDERIKSVMIHIRLKDEKIWVEEDWTEEGVATDLIRKGVEQKEIVLAFHPPHIRQYTEFAIA